MVAVAVAVAVTVTVTVTEMRGTYIYVKAFSCVDAA